MKKTTAVVLILATASLLAGCDSARKALTQTKAGPDEFAVYTRAPLTIPPDYGLRPPANGKTAESAAVTTRNETRRVLLGSTTAQTQTLQASTPGITVLLAMAGAADVEPGIRDLVDSETSSYASKDVRFIEKLMYGDDANGTGTVVDPVSEAKRIQENQAMGKPINDGETKMIDTKPTNGLGSVINGWFK